MASTTDEARPTVVAAPPDPSAAGRASATPATLRVIAFGRRHALFLVLLTAGTALRAVTMWAYQPAFIFFDSSRYLRNAADLEPLPLRPIGYPAFLRLLPLENELAVVPLVQHAMGLLMAVLIYVLLLRLGVRRWLAALAAAPVLLDAYQLNIEHFVLSDTLFQFFLLAVVALLLWRRRPGVVLAGAAGLMCFALFVTRSNGLLVIAPAVLAVLFLRAGLLRVAALIALFTLPLGLYLQWFHSVNGSYAINGAGGQFLYARTATFADCTKFSMPEYERVLCPQEPLGDRLPVDDYMWEEEVSPFYQLTPPAGMTRDEVAGAWAKRVIRHQPVDYARIVAFDFLRGFQPARVSGPKDPAVERWHFQTKFPRFLKFKRTKEIIARHGGDRPVVATAPAGFLRSYQRVGYAPGPVLLAGLVAALVAALGVGRARRSGLRTASFLFAAAAVVVLLPPAMLQFSWRYQLPQLVLLPAAGAVAITALTRRPNPETAAPDAPGADPPACPSPGENEVVRQDGVRLEIDQRRGAGEP